MIRRHLFFFALIAVLSLGFADKTHAQTVADLQAQIQALTAQISALQGGQLTTSPAQTATFQTNLGYGLENNGDVMRLQTTLKQDGYFSGDITGNYYNVTLQAVKDFQTAHGIEATGFVGPQTRSALEVPTDDSPLSSPTGTVSGTNTSVNGSSSQTIGGVSVTKTFGSLPCLPSGGSSTITLHPGDGFCTYIHLQNQSGKSINKVDVVNTTDSNFSYAIETRSINDLGNNQSADINTISSVKSSVSSGALKSNTSIGLSGYYTSQFGMVPISLGSGTVSGTVNVVAASAPVVTSNNSGYGPSITSITPRTVPAGGTVIVNGANFDQGTLVTLAYDRTVVITPTVTSNSTLSFVVPADSTPSTGNFAGVTYSVVLSEKDKTLSTAPGNTNVSTLVVSAATTTTNPPITIGTSACSISSFTANPASVSSGQITNLSYAANGCWTMYLSGGEFNNASVPSAAGLTSTHPLTQNTTYTLTGGDLQGIQTTKSLTVNVSVPITVTPPPVTTTGSANNPLVAFTVSGTNLPPGQSTFFSLVTTNASSCTVTPSIGTGNAAFFSGVQIYPTQSTTYTATCTNASGGSTSQSMMISVGAQNAPAGYLAPIQLSITADPTTIIAGQTTTLTWMTHNALSCQSAGIEWTGSGLSGTQVVAPTRTSNYSLLCYDLGHVPNMANVTVTVKPANSANVLESLQSILNALSAALGR